MGTWWQAVTWRSSFSRVFDRCGQCVHANGRLLCMAIT
jgi:hypothetical protein